MASSAAEILITHPTMEDYDLRVVTASDLYASDIIGIYKYLPLIKRPGEVSTYTTLQFVKEKFNPTDKMIVIQYRVDNKNNTSDSNNDKNKKSWKKYPWKIFDGSNAHILYVNSTDNNGSNIPTTGWIFYNYENKSWTADNILKFSISQRLDPDSSLQVNLIRMKFKGNEDQQIILPLSSELIDSDMLIYSPKRNIPTNFITVSRESASYWSKSIKILLEKLKQSERMYEDQKFKKYEADLTNAKMTLFAGYYIERDVQRTDRTVDSFPDAIDIKESYSNFTQNLEIFSMEVIDFLFNKNVMNLVELFFYLYDSSLIYVENILKSAKENLQTYFNINICNKYKFEKELHKIFWYSTMQAKAIQIWKSDDFLNYIRNQTSELSSIHQYLLEACSKGDIQDYSADSDITIETLAQFMLKFHFIAQLSDPPCQFYRKPGEKVIFDPVYFEEVLGPPGKKKTMLTSSDSVTVLFPGILFYLSADCTDHKVVSKAKVIRDSLSETTNNSVVGEITGTGTSTGIVDLSTNISSVSTGVSSSFPTVITDNIELSYDFENEEDDSYQLKKQRTDDVIINCSNNSNYNTRMEDHSNSNIDANIEDNWPLDIFTDVLSPAVSGIINSISSIYSSDKKKRKHNDSSDNNKEV